jgi:hypothetical protein
LKAFPTPLEPREKQQIAKEEQICQKQSENTAEPTAAHKPELGAGIESYGNIEDCGLAPYRIT